MTDPWRLCAAALSFALMAASLRAQQEPPPQEPPTSEPTAVPGRLHLQLEHSVWEETFTLDLKRRGLERLRPKSALAQLLTSLDVVRLWRSYAVVEEPIASGRIRVQSYAQWEKKWDAKRPRRPNERPYEPLSIASATSMFELQLKGDAGPALLATLRTTAGVVAAEQVVRPTTDFTPNDPGWVSPTDPAYSAALAAGRWGFHNTGPSLGPDFLSDFDIDAPEGWDIQRGDPSLTAAVHDLEVDVAHADLYLNIFVNNGEVPAAIARAFRASSTEDGLPGELTLYDLNVASVVRSLSTMGFSDTNSNGRIDGVDVVAWWSDGSDDDGNGYLDDLIGWNFVTGDNRPFTSSVSHGQGTAGLIAASANNGIDIAGVAHRVRILPITVDRSLASYVYASTFPQVRVMNASLSHQMEGATQPEINRFFRSLNARGITFVTSLGNRDWIIYGSDPAQREEVVAVTNFTSAGRRAFPLHSSAGPKTDVAAPAENVVSLRGGGGTSVFGGTSGASPMTAGVAALVMSQWPELSPEQVRQFLRMTASDPVSVAGDEGENTPGWDLYSGWGLVNARNALSSAAARTEYAEANITSRFKNFVDQGLIDGSSSPVEMAIGDGSVSIRALIGLPRAPATEVTWTLRRSPNWDMSGAVVVDSGRSRYSEDALLTTIDSDGLDGRQVLELEVRTPSGVVSRDRAVIDLPRAYLAAEIEGSILAGTATLRGLAYGPGFARFRVLVAPGWIPAGPFTEIASVASAVRPELSVEPGISASPRPLLSIDLDPLPIIVPASGQVTIRLVTEGLRSWQSEARVIIATAHPPLRAGFPVGGFFQSGSSTAVDLDGDGQKEIIITGTSGIGDLKVLRADGTDFPHFPIRIEGPEYIYEAPSVGDLDGDGRPEIVVRTTNGEDTNWIRVIRTDGTLAAGEWPVRVDVPFLRLRDPQNPPVLADVDRDGRLDVIVSFDVSDSAPVPLVRAFRHDGTLIREFTSPFLEAFRYMGPVAAGDIDGDGSPEVLAVSLFPSFAPTLWVWRADGTVLWHARTQPLGTRETWGPQLIDIGGDGRLEIVVASGRGPLTVLDSTGTILAGAGVADIHRLAVAQLDPGAAPSELSIVEAVNNYSSTLEGYEHFVNLFEANTLTARPGWAGGVRYSAGTPDAQPLVADFLGGPTLEIASTNGPQHLFDPPDVQTVMSVCDASGTPISDSEWPIRFPRGGVSGTPVISDLDGDGQLNLVVANGRADGRIYVFDLRAAAHAGAIAWGEYGHDPRRSSNYHGDVRILTPNTAHSQIVGPFDDPSRQTALLVRVEFSRGRPAGGADTDPSRWRVKIGAVDTTVREVARVGGEHWLVANPVAQPAAGTQTLRLEFDDGGIRTWDAYKDAVVYESAAPEHVVIPVIDKSGSMREHDKIEAARTAARLFVSSAYDDDQVGIVAFEDTGGDYLGGVLRAGDHRARIDRAFDLITAGFNTSIGAGIELGLDLLGRGEPGRRWGMIVLSDGLENRAPFWRSIVGRVADTRVVHPDFTMSAVALGPDADLPLMEDIARTGGGDFYPVALGHSVSMLNRLADAYHFAREQIDGTSRLATYVQTLGRDESLHGDVDVPFGARRLQFAFNWDQETVTVQMMRPDGSVVRPTDAGVTFASGVTSTVFTIASPMPGRWHASSRNEAKGKVEVLLAASAAIPYRLHLFWQADRLFATVTAPKVVLRDVAFATVVTRPDKKTFQIVLEPTEKGSSVFSAKVPFELPGGYLITITANVPGQSPVTVIRQSGVAPKS